MKEEHDYDDAGVRKAQLDPKAKAGTFRPVPTVSNAMQTVISTGGPDEDALLATGNKLYTTEDTLKVKDIAHVLRRRRHLQRLLVAGPGQGREGDAASFFRTYVKAIPDMHQMPLTNQCGHR